MNIEHTNKYKKEINGRSLVLASHSPRRIEMMKEHGFDPEVIRPDVREVIPPFLTPEEAVMYLAMIKAFAVKEQLKKDDQRDSSMIIAADTIVVSSRQILGKPDGKADARRMLLSLSGTTHSVITGMCLAASDEDLSKCFYETTDVTFSDLPEDELEEYLDTDEPYDKAGAYGIQGTFSKYVEKTSGDTDNVIGLPWQRFMFEAEQF